MRASFFHLRFVTSIEYLVGYYYYRTVERNHPKMEIFHSVIGHRIIPLSVSNNVQKDIHQSLCGTGLFLGRKKQYSLFFPHRRQKSVFFQQTDAFDDQFGRRRGCRSCDRARSSDEWPQEFVHKVDIESINRLGHLASNVHSNIHG